MEKTRAERRASARSATRAGILGAARRVAERDGARNLSLRSVARETGFAPAALYVYFRGKDELMLALAADDLSRIAHAMREVAGPRDREGRFRAVAAVALDLLATTETLAAASASLSPATKGSEMGRLFNGRFITALTALSRAAGKPANSREEQADTLLAAAALAGLALLQRTGRLQALGFSPEEMVARLDDRFSSIERAT